MRRLETATEGTTGASGGRVPMRIGKGAPLGTSMAVCAVGAGAILVGAGVAYGYVVPLAVIAVVAAALWLGSAHLRYAVPALLLILALNGVPGLNLKEYAVPGSFRPQDVFVIGLIAVAAGEMLFASRRPLPRLQRYLWIWAPLFLVVWLLAMARGMDAGAPWLKAALFGRDFLYFAALAPLAGYLFADRARSRRFCLIVGAWTGVFSLLLILASLSLVDSSLVNPLLTNEVGRLLRIYTPMTSLVALAFAFSLAYLLLEAGPERRWPALLAVLTGLACALSLTRALYFGLTLGVVISATVWALRSGIAGRLMRRRLISTAAIIGVVGAVGLAAVPQVGQSGPVSTVNTRISSGVSELVTGRSSEGGSTLAGRESKARGVLNYLGGSWPLGLGFVPPSVQYVPFLPNGSIRDPDLGVVNGIVTMGAIGTVMLYVPILLMLVMLLRHSVNSTASWRFAPLGLMIWGLTVVVSSATLVILFETTGLALTALVLGYAGRLLGDRDDKVIETPGRSSPNPLAPRNSVAGHGIRSPQSAPD